MFRHLLAALFALSCMSVAAQTPAESLSRCLGENTSGKERKELARWVFFAMAAHPEIKEYATASAPQAAEQSHRFMANTVMRLLTESCAPQTRAAFKEGGSMAIQIAFQTLGQLAMQELMTDRAVLGNMAAFEKHLDQNKLNQVLRRE